MHFTVPVSRREIRKQRSCSSRVEDRTRKTGNGFQVLATVWQEMVHFTAVYLFLLFFFLRSSSSSSPFFLNHYQRGFDSRVCERAFSQDLNGKGSSWKASVTQSNSYLREMDADDDAIASLCVERGESWCLFSSHVDTEYSSKWLTCLRVILEAGEDFNWRKGRTLLGFRLHDGNQEISKKQKGWNPPEDPDQTLSEIHYPFCCCFAPEKQSMKQISLEE